MNLTKFDLNLLLAFNALMETGSVTAAAERMGIRQPAMSAALGRLRLHFEDELFIRAGRRMRPTPKAERLAPHISAALSALSDALGEAAGFEPSTATTLFSLALTDYASVILGPRVLSRIRAQAPCVNVRIIGYEKQDVERLIAEGLVDLAVGVFRNPPERCVVTGLFEDRFVGMARKGHPGLRHPLSVEAYAGLEHVLFTLRRDRIGEIDQALAEHGLQRRVTLSLPYILALPGLLEDTDLVAAVPERLATHLLAGRNLATFPLPLTLSPWRVEMIWDASARSDAASAWLRQQIINVATELR